MSRFQLALRVPDLRAYTEFYATFFGSAPAKEQPGYANFAITDPSLKLVLIQDQSLTAPDLDHLGVEVKTPDEVTAAAVRLAEQGLDVSVEDRTVCCYAAQKKALVTAPGGELVETYVVLEDTDAMDKDEASRCCLKVAFPGLPLNQQSGKQLPLARP
jgi:catechol 2,3-dioxygenase-like lactoylglutathione lyase family enzyme